MIATQFVFFLQSISWFFQLKQTRWTFWMSFLSIVTLSKAGFGGNPFASWAGFQIQNAGTLRCRSDSIRFGWFLRGRWKPPCIGNLKATIYASSTPSSARQRRKDTNFLSFIWRKFLVVQSAIRWFVQKKESQKPRLHHSQRFFKCQYCIVLLFSWPPNR